MGDTSVTSTYILKEKTASIRCDDHAETLEFTRTTWREGGDWFDFSIKDGYIGKREEHGLFSRFRRAWKAFRNKPIVWAEIIVTDKARAEAFLRECLTILHDE